jgi:hypothetical protein
MNEQIILFNDTQNRDDYNYTVNDVDLNSHFDIFNCIYSQVI